MGTPRTVTQLTREQTTFLASLGFQDQDKSGTITANEIPNYDKTPHLQSDQIQALQNLAKLAGDPQAIDGDDLHKIMTDPKALAQVMANDPEYTKDIVHMAILEANHQEVKSDDVRSDARDGIPPVAFKRLVYYAQLGLNHLSHSKNLSMNGVYGSQTKAKIAEFQRVMGLSTGPYGQKREGQFIDRTTLGSLILRLRYTPQEMAKELGLVKSADYPDNMKSTEDLDRLLTGLQYLYPNEVGPWRIEGRLDEARPAFRKHFEADRVGPKVAAEMAQRILALGYLK